MANLYWVKKFSAKMETNRTQMHFFFLYGKNVFVSAAMFRTPCTQSGIQKAVLFRPKRNNPGGLPDSTTLGEGIRCDSGIACRKTVCVTSGANVPNGSPHD